MIFRRRTNDALFFVALRFATSSGQFANRFQNSADTGVAVAWQTGVAVAWSFDKTRVTTQKV